MGRRQGSPDERAGPSDDVRLLGSMGYAQELGRRMSAFSNLAISLSTICILAGGITSLQLGVGAVGGAAAGLVWPLGVCFALVVALPMAQIASAFPTAGGLYHWSSLLGGRGWGWGTAWFNLAGLVFVTAAVDVGTYNLFVNFVGPLLGLDPTRLGLVHQAFGVAVIGTSHALLNHVGIRVTTLLTDVSGYLIFVVALLLTAGMLCRAPSLPVSRLWTFVDNAGPAGGDTWPAGRSLPVMALLALMWPIYTITGFDASAHTSEETIDAARNVPRGILRSVYLSGLVGWVMVTSFVLAMPDVTIGARQGANLFPWLMTSILPGTAGRILWIGIVAANYLCGLACLTSTSRMMYAFARDGGLPLSPLLRRVSPRWRTPVPAVWTTAALALASTLYAPAYSTLTTACVILLYVSYVMPTLVAMRALGRRWTRQGPFDLGPRLFRVLGTVAVLGAALVVWIGVQPPNEKALTVTAATAAVLFTAWWLGVRHTFRGPPVGLDEADAALAGQPPRHRR